jgi:hypothetical protein
MLFQNYVVLNALMTQKCTMLLRLMRMPCLHILVDCILLLSCFFFVLCIEVCKVLPLLGSI